MKKIFFVIFLGLIGCVSDPVGVDSSVKLQQQEDLTIYKTEILVLSTDTARANVYKVLVPGYDYSCVFISGYIDIGNNKKRYISGVSNDINFGSIATSPDKYYVKFDGITIDPAGYKVVVLYTKI
jgi:hypothetical protein